jgi:hypothetical protein
MAFIDQIDKLTKQLYPSGRAFKMPKDGFFQKLHDSLNLSEARAYTDAKAILGSILPDTDNFTAEDAAMWEQKLGMITNEDVALADRKAAILRKMNHPGTIKARQSASYIQGQLQAAGFDVDVVENVFLNGLVKSPLKIGIDFIKWRLRTSATDNNWTSVAYGNGVWVAVSSSGTGNRVMSSSDGINWTIRTSAADNNWTSVVYGASDNLFVAVASSGSDRVMTSPDGITWTLRSTAGDNVDWRSVTYGGGRFVAVGDYDAFFPTQVMWSNDGITWNTVAVPGTNDFKSVTWSGTRFIAVSNNGTNRVMRSTDGTSWSAISADYVDWSSITSGNNILVAVGTSGVGKRAMYSLNDGFSWRAVKTPADNNWTSVSYLSNLFIAVSSDGTQRSMYSDDGINWLIIDSAASNQWTSIFGGSDKFVAVSQTGTGNRVMTLKSVEIADLCVDQIDESTDWKYLVYGSERRMFYIGNSIGDDSLWNDRNTPSGDWYSVTYGNGLWVIVGNNAIITSPDGITWTSQTSPSASLWTSVTFGSGRFVAVGDGVSMYSDDGVNWFSGSSIIGSWASVVYNGSLFVAVANFNTNRVMTSANGSAWTARTPASVRSWNSVTYGMGQFVAVASSGDINRVMTSSDGITWASQAAASSSLWQSVCFSEELNLFCAVGTDSIMTSPDGITWTSRTPADDSGSIGLLKSIAYGMGKFVVTWDNGGKIQSSIDGITWTSEDGTLVFSNSANCVFFGNYIFMAVGVTNEVGSSPIITDASVQSLRKDEFRQLILKLKPAHTVAVLFVNYV